MATGRTAFGQINREALHQKIAAISRMKQVLHCDPSGTWHEAVAKVVGMQYSGNIQALKWGNGWLLSHDILLCDILVHN